MPLEEYKDLVGSLAGICTILQLFSPAFLCKDIVKRGSTQDIEVMPFIGGLVLSILFYQNAALIGDSTMLYVNVFALFLSVTYLFVYFLYTKEKVKFYLKLSKAAIFVAVLISYAQRENKDVVQFRFGLIVTLIMFSLIGSPLFSIKEMYRSKNTDGLPMPLIISGTAVTLLWFLYGVIIDEMFVQIQNLVAFLLNVSQLILYVVCAQQRASKKSKSTEKHKLS